MAVRCDVREEANCRDLVVFKTNVYAIQGIRVNAVAPGPICTPLIPATMPEEKVKQFGTDTPLGRPGQPAELAPAYVFFAAQESSYVTGEVLGVTGGKLTK